MGNTLIMTRKGMKIEIGGGENICFELALSGLALFFVVDTKKSGFWEGLRTTLAGPRLGYCPNVSVSANIKMPQWH